MMNPFLMSTKDRLNHWKDFRKSLTDCSEIEQLQKVAEYWSHTPLQTIAYDIDAPDSWPSPWEMMSANDWCRNSIAIGMEFTLRLAGWNADRLELKWILDRNTSVMALMVVIDEKWVLNYDWGLLNPYVPFGVVLRRYKWNGRQYTEIK
jgi:hypothetical protein